VVLDHARHPVGAPAPRRPAEPTQDAIQRRGEVGDVIALAEERADPSRLRKRSHQRVRRLAPERLPELEPAELQFLAGLAHEPDRQRMAAAQADLRLHAARAGAARTSRSGRSAPSQAAAALPNNTVASRCGLKDLSFLQAPEPVVFLGKEMFRRWEPRGVTPEAPFVRQTRFRCVRHQPRRLRAEWQQSQRSAFARVR
jgi:hypothetical protein